MNQATEILLESKVFRVLRRRVETESGETLTRDVVDHPGAVVILPLLPNDQICLIRNRRIAVGQTLIELPAGTCEPGEPRIETARRELLEETGYRCERLELLTEFYASPGILNERMSVFVAEELTPGKQQLEQGEAIQPLIVSRFEALAMACDGRIQDAKTLVGLFHYERTQQTGRRPGID